MVLAYLFLLVPFLLAGLVLGVWALLLLITRTGVDAIRPMPYQEFFGFGGPDDPFTVRVPREEYAAVHSRPLGQTGTVRVAREAGDEQLPRPDRRTGLSPAA
jgi:hypothetical protein